MTVLELIEKLKKFDYNKEVLLNGVIATDCYSDSYIGVESVYLAIEGVVISEGESKYESE